MAAVPVIAAEHNPASLNAGATNYFGVGSGFFLSNSSSENIRQIIWYSAGTFSKLAVYLYANDRTTASTIRFRNNGVNGNQVVTCTAATTGSFQDGSNTDAISSGDLLSCSVVVGTGGTQFVPISVGFLFDATTNTRVRYARAYSSSLVTNPATHPIVGQRNAAGAQDDALVGVAGTFRNGAVVLGNNTRTSAMTASIDVDDVASALAITITAATTGTFSDTTNTVAVSVGQRVRWGMTGGGAGGAHDLRIPSVDFETTSGANMLHAHGQPAQVVAGSTNYSVIAGYMDSFATTENMGKSTCPGPTVATALSTYVSVNTSTNGGTMKLRANGSDTTVTHTIAAGTTGWFSATGMSVAIAALDQLTCGLTTTAGSGAITVRHVGTGVGQANTAPVVDAGIDQTITLPATATMAATVTDDGNPNPPATVTLTWSQTSGPAAASFSATNVEDPVVTFPTNGTYVLRLTASDSVLSAYDEVTITVNQTGPTVNAGPDQTGIAILEVVQLDGTVSDDGYPVPPGALTLTWSKQSGPGTASFSSTSVVDPTVALSAQGTYVLRLTADDGLVTAFDEMTITVGSAVDPGNSLCGSGNVLTWVEQTSTHTDASTSTRVTADAPLNDPSSYYSGKKEPRILELPTITRQLSDVRGQWQAGTMRWREAEVDRIVRRRYAGATTYPLTYTTDVCRMIREEDWRDREIARLMFVGHRLSTTPAEDLSIEHESGDVLARDLVKAGQELQLPQRLFDSAFTPGIPTALLEVPEPIIYGTESDAVAPDTPPSLIASATTGGYMDGIFPIHGFAPLPGPTPPAALTPSEGAGSLMLGDQPSDNFYFNIVGLNAGGQWGDPTYFAINAEVSHTLTGNSKSITVTWVNPGVNTAATWRVFMGYYLSGVRHVQYRDVAGAATSCVFDNMPDQTEIGNNDWSQLGTGCAAADVGYSHYRVAAVLASGAVTAVDGTQGFARYYAFPRTARIEVDATTLPATTTHVRVWKVPPGWVAGQPTYGYLEAPITQTNAAGHVYVDDDWLGTGLTVEDPQVEIGAFNITAYYGGLELVPLYGAYWHRWFVCGHAVKAVDGVYLDDTPNYTSPTKLVGEIGVTWFVPGGTNYNHVSATPYRDFNGRRYTVIYAYGPDADALALGTGTLRVNVRGIEDVGDGTGTLLSDIHDQFKHWMTNFFLQDYQSGAWLSVPTWAPIAGWPKIDTGSWDTAKAAAAAAFGAELTGGGVIAELASKRDWLARWLVSSGTRIGINAGGQWTLVRHDPDAASAAATYTEVRHIQAGSLTFEPLHDEHWMTIPYRFNLRDGEWSEGEVTDQTAIDDYGEEREGPVHELYFVKSSAVAIEVMTLVRDRHKTLPWRVSFETIDLCATGSDLGDVIGLTHTAGLHVDGWENFLLMLEGHITMPGPARVRLTGRTNQAPHE